MPRFGAVVEHGFEPEQESLSTLLRGDGTTPGADGGGLVWFTPPTRPAHREASDTW
jgi:hypothetical protein